MPVALDHRCEGAGVQRWLTTACTGRRLAPPLMLSVRRHRDGREAE